MAAWPELDELKQRLDIVSDEWDGADDYEPTRLTRLLADAIDWTKHKVDVDWDDDEDEPDEAMAQAALERAVELATEPQPTSTGTPRSQQVLYGKRRTFGIA